MTNFFFSSFFLNKLQKGLSVYFHGTEIFTFNKCYYSVYCNSIIYFHNKNITIWSSYISQIKTAMYTVTLILKIRFGLSQITNFSIPP